MKTSPAWPDAWTRAALSTAILATLETEPRHGYGIAGELETRGFGRPRGGSLYPLLSKLEEDGALVAHWEQGASGPGKRTYRLTDRGRDRLKAEREQWAQLTQALHRPNSPGNTNPARLDKSATANTATPRS